MASNVSSIAPQTVVIATMLTTLWVAIANTEAAGVGCAVAFAVLRFGLDGIRFAAMDFLEIKGGWVRSVFGCLTLTLSRSRFAPDLERTMTRPRPRMLSRSGKPKLTRGDGLRFQFGLNAGRSNSDRETIEGRQRLLEQFDFPQIDRLP